MARDAARLIENIRDVFYHYYHYEIPSWSRAQIQSAENANAKINAGVYLGQGGDTRPGREGGGGRSPATGAKDIAAAPSRTGESPSERGTCGRNPDPIFQGGRDCNFTIHQNFVIRYCKVMYGASSLSARLMFLNNVSSRQAKEKYEKEN